MTDEIKFNTSFGEKTVKKIGPALVGYIYHSDKEPFCYRLIPIQEVRSIESRERIKQLIGKPRIRGIAPVKDIFQVEVDGNNYLAMQYEIYTTAFWIHIIREDSAASNLVFFTEILKMLPFWWTELGQGIIPLPSEILFSDSTPFLLQLPLDELPGITNFLNEPERLAFLAPEFFRIRKKKRAVNGRNLDMYALGVGIYHGLHKEKERSYEPGDLSSRIQTDSTELLPDKKKLPIWSEKVVEIRSTYNLINQLMAKELVYRSFYDPDKLSGILEDNIQYFDPVVVIEKYRKEGKLDIAYGLVKDVLVTERSYEFLILAAEMANELELIFEAVEHYEDVISSFPASQANLAYIKQLEILVRQTPEFIYESVIARKTELFKKTESMIERNYKQLTFDEQDELVEDVARFLMMRDRYKTSAEILYPHLFDEQGKQLWWKFNRTIAYAECIAGQKRYDEARKMLADIRDKLDHVEQDEGRLDPEVILLHRKHLFKIEKRIVNQNPIQ